MYSSIFLLSNSIPTVYHKLFFFNFSSSFDKLVRTATGVLPCETAISSTSKPSRCFMRRIDCCKSGKVPITSSISCIFSSSTSFISGFSPPPMLMPCSKSTFSIRVPHQTVDAQMLGYNNSQCIHALLVQTSEETKVSTCILHCIFCPSSESSK